MKILMLADRMESGGAETHVETLARELIRRGHSVTVLSAGGRIADRMERAGILQLRFSWTERDLLRLLRARRAFRAAMKKHSFDLLHGHTRGWAFLLGISRGRKRLPPAVFTVHAAFFRRPWLRFFCFWGERTIAVGEDLRAWAADRLGVPAQRIEVIPNGVDCHRFHATEGARRGDRILFVSRLDADCSLGAELLCEIAPGLRRKFPQLQIRIAGGGDQLARLQKSAAEANRLCGDAEAVVLLGYLDDPSAEFFRADIFVGVSRAAMEGAAGGCAVVLCGNEGRGGILTPDAPLLGVGNFCCRGEALPHAAWLERTLEALLADTNLRRRVAKRGREWILRDYGAEDMAARTEAVYFAVTGIQKRQNETKNEEGGGA